MLAALAVLVFVASRIPVETGSAPNQSATASPGPLSPTDLATIHGDIRRLQLAIFEENVETVLQLAHPRWINAIGGRDKVR